MSIADNNAAKPLNGELGAATLPRKHPAYEGKHLYVSQHRVDYLPGYIIRLPFYKYISSGYLSQNFPGINSSIQDWFISLVHPHSHTSDLKITAIWSDPSPRNRNHNI